MPCLSLLRLVSLLSLTGCITASLGGYSQLRQERPFDATLDVRISVAENDSGLLGVVGRTRFSDTGADVGLGAEYCLRSDQIDFYLHLCGRVFPLELGARERRFDLGLMSPALGPGIWIPITTTSKDGPVRGYADQLGVQIQAWGGLDVRPLHERKIQPTVGLTVGLGWALVRQ